MSLSLPHSLPLFTDAAFFIFCSFFLSCDVFVIVVFSLSDPSPGHDWLGVPSLSHFSFLPAQLFSLSCLFFLYFFLIVTSTFLLLFVTKNIVIVNVFLSALFPFQFFISSFLLYSFFLLFFCDSSKQALFTIFFVLLFSLCELFAKLCIMARGRQTGVGREGGREGVRNCVLHYRRETKNGGNENSVGQSILSRMCKTTLSLSLCLKVSFLLFKG